MPPSVSFANINQGLSPEEPRNARNNPLFKQMTNKDNPRSQMCRELWAEFKVWEKVEKDKMMSEIDRLIDENKIQNLPERIEEAQRIVNERHLLLARKKWLQMLIGRFLLAREWLLHRTEKEDLQRTLRWTRQDMVSINMDTVDDMKPTSEWEFFLEQEYRVITWKNSGIVENASHWNSASGKKPDIQPHDGIHRKPAVRRSPVTAPTSRVATPLSEPHTALPSHASTPRARSDSLPSQLPIANPNVQVDIPLPFVLPSSYDINFPTLIQLGLADFAGPMMEQKVKEFYSEASKEAVKLLHALTELSVENGEIARRRMEQKLSRLAGRQTAEWKVAVENEIRRRASTRNNPHRRSATQGVSLNPAIDPSSSFWSKIRPKVRGHRRGQSADARQPTQLPTDRRYWN